MKMNKSFVKIALSGLVYCSYAQQKRGLAGKGSQAQYYFHIGR